MATEVCVMSMLRAVQAVNICNVRQTAYLRAEQAHWQLHAVLAGLEEQLPGLAA